MNDLDPADQSKPELALDELLNLLDTSGIGIWSLDFQSGDVWRNSQHDRIFGYRELLPRWSQRTFLDHVHPDEREDVETRYREAVLSDQPPPVECRILRADGEVRWISVAGFSIRNDSRQLTKMIGRVLDVTHVKRNEERLRVLFDELNHRVRNTLTIVQAIAARSFRNEVEREDGRKDFGSRLNALAVAHDLLTDRKWSGASLRAVVEKTIAAFCRSADPSGPSRFTIEGPGIDLSPKQAVGLAMALNELATNAIKHGSLTVPEGRVAIAWRRIGSGETDRERVELLWREWGGPPVEPSNRNGFGTTLLERLIPQDLDGRVERRFHRDGLTCRIEFGAYRVNAAARTGPPAT